MSLHDQLKALADERDSALIPPHGVMKALNFKLMDANAAINTFVADNLPAILAALKDSERISELEQCKFDIELLPPGEHGGSADNWWVGIHYKRPDSMGPFIHEGRGTNLRAAIDAAIEGSKQT